MPRIVTTPIAPLVLPESRLAPRRLAPDVVAAALPGPGRDRLAAGDVLVVTTGQQPGLFTGPLYTVYKALSAMALAARLERERRAPVVPVFWVAGDDHDFAEANHAWFLDKNGELAQAVLRERAAEAPLLPLEREPCGPEIAGVLRQLDEGTPDSEFKPGVLEWLGKCYRPEATLADAFAQALDALLGPRGLVVLRVHDPRAKRAAAPWVLKGLDVTLPDGYAPVFVDASQGRDRLQKDGDGFVTRRSGERFSRADLTRLARDAPERLSPNVLLRPAVEAARNAAPSGAQTIEKKLVASLKRLEGETLIRQIARARAAVYPQGQPQERELTLGSFSIRYGPALVDALEQEVARWAGAS